MIALLCILYVSSKDFVSTLETDRGYLFGNHDFYASLFDIKNIFPYESNSAKETFFGGKNAEKSNGKYEGNPQKFNSTLPNVLFYSKKADRIGRRRKFPKNNTTVRGNKTEITMYEVPILNMDTAKSHNTTSEFSVSNIWRQGRKLVDGIVQKIVGDNSTVDSEGRFLNIFEIVNFNNADCITIGGIRGVCLHPFECSSAGGTQMESCADGYGVCCKFQYSCGEQSSANCSSFTNPGFPKPSLERLSCTMTIQKAHPSVTQLRLSFVQMELQPPKHGTCVDDQFVVTGQNINNIIPILCGINNGQHMYVEVGEASGPFYISILSVADASRVFQIEICQLSPSSMDAAPSGCLQYHTETTGELETYNYQLQSTTSIYRAPGYFNNLNYAICIQRASGSCSITYSTGADRNSDYEFQILNYDSDGIPLIPPEQAGAEIFNCPDDYIIVNGIRLCGERLNDASVTEDFTVNAPVTELSAGPIALIFRTNGNVTGRGFHLFYKQNPCVNPRKSE